MSCGPAWCGPPVGFSCLGDERAGPGWTPRIADVEPLGLAEHLEHPVGRRHVPDAGHAGVAGGALCGDLVRISLRVDGDRVGDAGFEASGCGAAQAAGSAAVALVRGAPLLDAARVGTAAIAAE